MSRFVIYKVHLLYSGLNNEDERQSTPITETMHCTSTCHVPSRYAGETGTRKSLQQRMREKCLCAAPAHVNPASSPHPARSAGWPHGPCFALASCIPESNACLDLAAVSDRCGLVGERRFARCPHGNLVLRMALLDYASGRMQWLSSDANTAPPWLAWN